MLLSHITKGRYVLQSNGTKGHSRTPSDVEFRELTWRDAKESMHNELYKLLNTAKSERREVSPCVPASLFASFIACLFII